MENLASLAVEQLFSPAMITYTDPEDSKSLSPMSFVFDGKPMIPRTEVSSPTANSDQFYTITTVSLKSFYKGPEN